MKNPIKIDESNDLEINQTSRCVTQMEMVENDSALAEEYYHGSRTIEENVRIAFCRNEIITHLVSALVYSNDVDLADEMPEDFNDQCLEYLRDYCHYNYLTLSSLLSSLKKQ